MNLKGIRVLASTTGSILDQNTEAPKQYSFLKKNHLNLMFINTKNITHTDASYDA